MAPTLYMFDVNPGYHRVRMLAEIIGLQLELKHVDISAKEHKSPEFLKMNPIGVLPILKDGDFCVSDSHAIMTYLLSVYGGEKRESLYPSDVRTRALIDQAMFFDTGVFFIKLKQAATGQTGLEGITEESKQLVEECYSVLEAYLQTRKYLASDHLTIADLAVGTTANVTQSLYKLDSAKFPRAADWLSRLEQEPSYQKIIIPNTKTSD